jgi:catechol 2,3-dioxygenase-like lactoylglutathione lyase family enzyme
MLLLGLVTLLPAARAADAPAQFSNAVVWVADVPKAAEFYRRVFGLKTHVQMNFGKKLWMELDTGSTKLSFMSESEADELFAKKYRRNRPLQMPQAIGLSFRVANAAAAYAAALQAGARPVHAPLAQPWGASIARILDPNGVIVDIIGPPAAAK